MGYESVCNRPEYSMNKLDINTDAELSSEVELGLVLGVGLSRGRHRTPWWALNRTDTCTAEASPNIVARAFNGEAMFISSVVSV